MPLYLVRHAKAGSRADFDGDDRDRPLTQTGHRQAVELCRRLASVSPSLLVSSPYLRCVQTLEPLAVIIGSEVERDERLAEFAEQQRTPDKTLVALLRAVPDRAVMCSHGDVIPAAIDALAATGMCIVGEPRWQKASVWVIERDLDRFVSASAWPPPRPDSDD